jgi:hypothetical protein
MAMNADANSLLYLFFGVTAVTLLWRIVRDKDWKNFAPDNFKSSWKIIAAFSVIAVLLFAGLNVVKAGLFAGAAYFVAAFILPFLISELNLAPFSRSMILLMASVGLTLLTPVDQRLLSFSCALGGLSVWKLTSNLIRSELATMLDILPPFIWLAASLWWDVAHTGPSAGQNLGMVLGVLTISILMRWVQMPLLWEDPVYLKRIVIAISSGLLALIVFNKLLLATTFAQLAGLTGVGYLASFLLTSMDNNKSESSIQDVLTKLTLIGGLTLLGGRLFGSEGLLILAATTVILSKSGLTQIAGMFWALRVVQQSFQELFNSNVTGINVNHEYVGAALYFGLAGACVAGIAFRNYKSGSLLAAAATFMALAVSAGSSYLLHSEPTAGFVLGSVVGGTIFCVAGKEIFASDFAQYQSVILCPAILTCFCLMLSPLLEVGDSATTHDRLVVVGSLTALLLVGSLISFFMSGGMRKKSVENEPVATSTSN